MYVYYCKNKVLIFDDDECLVLEEKQFKTFK